MTAEDYEEDYMEEWGEEEEGEDYASEDGDLDFLDFEDRERDEMEAVHVQAKSTTSTTPSTVTNVYMFTRRRAMDTFTQLPNTRCSTPGCGGHRRRGRCGGLSGLCSHGGIGGRAHFP